MCLQLTDRRYINTNTHHSISPATEFDQTLYVLKARAEKAVRSDRHLHKCFERDV